MSWLDVWALVIHPRPDSAFAAAIKAKPIKEEKPKQSRVKQTPAAIRARVKQLAGKKVADG